MVKCGVLTEVRAELLNTIQTSFGFKGLKCEMQRLGLLLKKLDVLFDDFFPKQKHIF
jgi:hypothetical protein